MAAGDRSEVRLYGPSNIGASAGTVATVPASRVWVTKQIILCNTNNVDAWVSVAVGDVTDSTNCFMYQLPISGNDTMVFDTALVMTEGETIQATSDRGGITIIGNGWSKEL